MTSEGRSIRMGVRIASLVPLFLATHVAAEGSIELIAGERAPVCQAYLAAAKKWEHTAVKCIGDLPLSGSEISRFSSPILKREFSTQEDDPTLPLRASAGRFVRGHDVNEANYFYADKLMGWIGSEEQRRAAQQGLRNRSDEYFTESVIRTAELDVDNDGFPDKIFFYPHCVGGTVVNRVTMSSPLVVNEAGNGINEKVTQSILRAPINRFSVESIRRRSDGTSVAVADIYSNSAFGFFRFRGKTYFDFWWDARLDATPNPLDANILRIYLANGDRARAVCAFRVDPVPALTQ